MEKYFHHPWENQRDFNARGLVIAVESTLWHVAELQQNIFGEAN